MVEDLSNAASEAFVYLYPLVLMEITRRHGKHMKMNEWYHFRQYPKGTFRGVVRPNFDTLYSSAWLDLTDGPITITMPDTSGRYYCMHMLDMWTDSFAVPGSRTTGTAAGCFCVAGPGWVGDIPPGATLIRSPTPYVWIINRVKTDGPGDYDEVHRIQDAMALTHVSGGPPLQLQRAPDDWDFRTPPMVQSAQLAAKEFFELAAQLLHLHPPHTSDGSQMMRMQRLGLIAGEYRNFSFDTLREEIRAALVEGASVGLKSIIDFKGPARPVNGWVVNLDLGVYGNQYLRRAFVAMIGLGAVPAEDAVYITTSHPIEAGVDYTIHFEKGQHPPGDAFWSLTLYDEQGFPVPNAAERYVVGSPHGLVFEEDGSSTLLISATDPQDSRRANWLPSPASGKFHLCIRMYDPRPELFRYAWTPPLVQPAGGGATVAKL